jgi:hypothetical protein
MLGFGCRFPKKAARQVLFNARDGVPEGGKLTIERANCYPDEVYVAALAGSVEASQYDMIAVSDTGAAPWPRIESSLSQRRSHASSRKALQPTADVCHHVWLRQVRSIVPLRIDAAAGHAGSKSERYPAFGDDLCDGIGVSPSITRLRMAPSNDSVRAARRATAKVVIGPRH